VYVVEYGKAWDFAAGTLLVREAGGSVTTRAGQHYSPEDHTQVLATNGILHAKVRELLTPFVAAHPTS
jgi:myo-inositol-1(or 4)-monophosphatase